MERITFLIQLTFITTFKKDSTVNKFRGVGHLILCMFDLSIKDMKGNYFFLNPGISCRSFHP